MFHMVCLSLWPKHSCSQVGHGLIHAFPTLTHRGSSYWWHASDLCKEHARSYRNFHSTLYPSIRIHYLLTHKPHKGLKCFLLKKKKKETLWARLWAQGTDFCPAEQSSHLGMEHFRKGTHHPEVALRENAHLVALNSKALAFPRADAYKNSPKNKPKMWPKKSNRSEAHIHPHRSSGSWQVVSAPCCSNRDTSKLCFGAFTSITTQKHSDVQSLGITILWNIIQLL